MKVFKCLSQNTSIAQDKVEKQKRQKHFLGFRQKKRRVGFISLFKENALPLVPSIITTKHTPGNNDASSRDDKVLVSRAGGSSMSSSNYESRPSVQSTPFLRNCKSGKADDGQDEFVVTTSSESATSDFFRGMTVNTSDYLPSFAVYESPRYCDGESIATDSSEVNCLNVALIASNSVSDSCMDWLSSSYGSVQSSVCNSAVDWSSIISNTTCSTECTANTSTATFNKGCSTSPSFDSSYSSISVRSVPVRVRPDGRIRKRPNVTTRSDTYLSTTAYRSHYYQKSTRAEACDSFKEQDVKEPERDSSTNHTAVKASICYASANQERLGGDSLNFTGIDFDSSAAGNSEFRDKKQTSQQVHVFIQKPSEAEACDSLKEKDVKEPERDSSTNHTAVKASICYASVNQERFGEDSLNFTGIDFDSSAAGDSKFRDKKQTSQQMDTDLSQLSVNVTADCPPSSLELKYGYIEQLMSLEQEFVNCMHFGIRKYSKPLQHHILTCYQHRTLFMNIEKLVKMSEANLKAMQDNAAPDDSHTSEDEHMMLYMPASVYDLEIQKQCQAYQLYGKKLEKSNKLLTELKQNRKFRDFVKSQHATRKDYKSHPSEWCPSLQEFINKPALHIQQLYAILNNILSVTPHDIHDGPTLVRVLDTIFNCMEIMKLVEQSECL